MACKSWVRKCIAIKEGTVNYASSCISKRRRFARASSYSATTSTIVNSGRNVQGKVVGSVVRHDVAKVALKWKYLTAKQWASVIGHSLQTFIARYDFTIKQQLLIPHVRCMFPTEQPECGEGAQTPEM